jgi:DmsE family decaheme c-type cytochrome
MKRPPQVRWAGVFAAAVLCAAGLTAQAPAAAAPAAPATYVGSETCHICHEEIFNSFQTNPHHVLDSDTTRGPGGGPDNTKGWKGKYCEACHGPGSIHAQSLDKKDILDPAHMSPAASDRICLSCHLNQPTQAGRIASTHAKNDIPCVTCHTMHGTPEQLVARKPDDINQKCASCHVNEWVSFQKPYHHKVPEGAMSCVDCHNPHGRNVTSTVRFAAADGEPTCYKCHGDKRGPFIYEHEVVRTDGCIACHEPHGSANPRMLTRNQPQVLCLECHANIGMGPFLGSTPPAFHNLRSPIYQTCVNCHIKIHGSNVSSALLQ